MHKVGNMDPKNKRNPSSYAGWLRRTNIHSADVVAVLTTDISVGHLGDSKV